MVIQPPLGSHWSGHAFLHHTRYSELPHINDAAYAIALPHITKGLIDTVQTLAMSDKLVDLETALHVIFHQVRQLSASLDTAKGTALPHSTRDKLKCCCSVLED